MIKTKKIYLIIFLSLLLVVAGFTIAQNVRAYQLVSAAQSMNDTGRYAEAQRNLNRTPSLLVATHILQIKQDETAKNKRWESYHNYQLEAARLITAGKYSEALILLSRISADFPTYPTVLNDITRATKARNDTRVATVAPPKKPTLAPKPNASSAPSATVTPSPAVMANPVISNALCRVDASLATDLSGLAQNMANVCLSTFPKIEQILSVSTYPAPHVIKLSNSTYAIGFAQGNEVSVQIDYIRKHPDDMGMVVHELAHVVQGYSSGPSWVTEGIADYVRNKLGYTTASNYVCNSTSNYLSGYNCSARLLGYVERTYSPNIIKELHTAMRSGTYTDDIFVRTTGKTPSQLYSTCLSSDCKGGKAA